MEIIINVLTWLTVIFNVIFYVAMFAVIALVLCLPVLIFLSRYVDRIVGHVIIDPYQKWYSKRMLRKINKVMAHDLEESKQLYDLNTEVLVSDISWFKDKCKETYLKIKKISSMRARSLIEFKNSRCQEYIEMYMKLDNVLEWRQTRIDVLKKIKCINFSQIISDVLMLSKIDHFVLESEINEFNTKYKDVISLCEQVKTLDIFDSLSDDENKHVKILLDKYGKELKYIYPQNEKYFKFMYDTYNSFFEQYLTYGINEKHLIKTITTQENNVKVIYPAGEERDRIIVAKFNFLVDILKYDPSRILLLTFTNERREHLEKKIDNNELKCLTFTSLASKLALGEFNDKVNIVSCAEIVKDIFECNVERDDDLVKAILTYLLNYISNIQSEHSYESDQRTDYFRDRMIGGIKSFFPDLNGPFYPRNEEERQISIFLHCHGIKFIYDAPYEFELTGYNHKQYKPTFTIVYDIKGRQKKVYLEHFLIDSNRNVPTIFVDNSIIVSNRNLPAIFYNNRDDEWEKSNKKYREAIIWKRRTHRSCNTALVETTSAMFHNNTWRQEILRQLREAGVPIKPISSTQIYQDIISFCPGALQNIIALVTSFISLMKANSMSMNEIINEMRNNVDERSSFILTKILQPCYERYQNRLSENGLIDEFDVLVKAAHNCQWRSGRNDYDYIIVDSLEYATTLHYELLKAVRNSLKSKIFSIGDARNSIYSTSGSNLTSFYRFERYFDNTEIDEIPCNWIPNVGYGRYSSSYPFRPNEISNTQYELRSYDGEENQIEVIKQILSNIPNSDSVLILCRYDSQIKKLGVIRNRSEFRGNILKIQDSIAMRADYAIIVSVNSGLDGFPSPIQDDQILNYVSVRYDQFEFAGERRLFKMAMSRAFKKTFVLYDQRSPSIFIPEIDGIEEKDRCPKCGVGSLQFCGTEEFYDTKISKKDTYMCSNRDFCDYQVSYIEDIKSQGSVAKWQKSRWRN